LTLVTRKGTRLEDPGAELLDQLTSFWDRYGRLTMSVLGAIAAIVIVGVLYLRAQAATEEKAAGKLAEAEIMFWQGYYPRSYDAAQQIIKQYPGSQSAVEAHRLAGDDAYWRGETGDFRKSIDEYRAYLKHRSQGMLADGARRSLAYALESDANALKSQGKTGEAETEFREAAATYEGLVGKFADRESSAEFLLAAARCYRLMNQREEAAKRLQRLIDQFGETTTANRARIELAEVTAGVR
jgi:tetratricopeptide (TPR) repeat protein